MKLRILFKSGLILFMIYIIYQLIMKLLGHSWSVEQVILAFVMANFGWTMSIQKQLFKLDSKFSEHTGEHKLIEYRISKLESNNSQ